MPSLIMFATEGPGGTTTYEGMRCFSGVIPGFEVALALNVDQVRTKPAVLSLMARLLAEVRSRPIVAAGDVPRDRTGFSEPHWGDVGKERSSNLMWVAGRARVPFSRPELARSSDESCWS